MHQVIHIHAQAPAKPAWGEPCNGCGVCCAAEPCPVGMLISRRRHGSCEALLWNAAERRYRCGVASEPHRFIAPRWLAGLAARLALRMIAAGRGCDCDLATHPAG
jgi:hypothetical protein